MSSTTPNLGLTKTTASETIGQNWAASNDSGGNFDIIDTKMGAVGNTSLQAQVNELSSQFGNLRIEFGDNTKELTPNLQDNWSTAIPNDGKTYFVKISALYGDFYGTICRYSTNYGTGIVSRYDGRVYRIQMNNGVCTAYQLQNRPIQIISTGEKSLSANGNISHTFNNKSIVLSAYSTSSDIVCSVYPSSGADSSGATTWWIHCRNATSNGAVASGNITCYLIYIDMA